jgi:hypothetical protein
MQHAAAPACGRAPACGAARLRAGRASRCAVRRGAHATAALPSGTHTQMGTSRKQNEDRSAVQARLRRCLAQRRSGCAQRT